MKNLKIIFFFVLQFFFLCINLFGDIGGFIINQRGNPVQNVEVKLKEKEMVTSTKENGEFFFQVEKGIYELIILNQSFKIDFTKENFVKIFIKTFEEEIFVEPPGILPENIPKKVLEIPKGQSYAEILPLLPNIYLNGLGGAFQTVSIGGMAKNRIQMEVNGLRVEGLRRAGTDLGTFHSEIFEGLNLYEVGLGFTHGSSAMGGTLDFSLRESFKEFLKTSLSFSSNNEKFSVSTKKGSKNYFLFAGYEEANSYKDGKGVRQDGFFKRGNLYGAYKFQGKNSINYVDLLLTKGWDIGKPFLSEEKTTYPKNNLDLLGFRGFYKNLSYQFGLIYQDLETKTTKEKSYLKSSSFQGKGYYSKGNLSFGLEFYSILDMDAENFLSTGFYKPLKNAKKYDTSLISSYETNFEKYKFFTGLRYNYFYSSNNVKEKKDTIPSFFLMVSKEGFFNYSLSFYNLYRFPSIEELFYSGMTARGYVQGNEKLKTEEGLGATLKIQKRIKDKDFAFLISYKKVDNFIERYKVSKDLYSYRNTEKVKIWEYVFSYQNNFSFLNFSISKGEDKKTGAPIDDQKPLTINGGFYKKIKRFEPFIFLTWGDRNSNPGPNEVERQNYFVLNLGSNYELNKLNLYVKIENLFDAAYTPQGDNKAVPQMGRNFIFGINFIK